MSSPDSSEEQKARTEQSDDETRYVDCFHCGETVDILEPGHFKTVSDQFAHEDCVADDAYESREKVATTAGVFRIKRVTIKEIVGHKESILESYWRAECPQCYKPHETETVEEAVREELVETVTACCNNEWLPPSDWVEDCDVCNTSHRESRGCLNLWHREPYRDPENHRYDCAECEWSGEAKDFDNHSGQCPECGTASVRAVELATDGGVESESKNPHADAYEEIHVYRDEAEDRGVESEEIVIVLLDRMDDNRVSVPQLWDVLKYVPPFHFDLDEWHSEEGCRFDVEFLDNLGFVDVAYGVTDDMVITDKGRALAWEVEQRLSEPQERGIEEALAHG